MRAFTSRSYAAKPSAACRARNPSRNISTCAKLDRRSAFVALCGGGLAIATPASAELATLYGLATPPTSYGGYGGNKNEAPKYKFDYPNTWKQLVINKVQKGTQGIDCIVQDGRDKKTKAFVVTLSRAGEDNKNFRLTDLEQTFQSFVGADYDLQDAVASADEIQSASRQKDGQQFYDYVVEGADAVYMSSITVDGGKVFALFVCSPARAFKAAQPTMRAMLDSFAIL